MQPYFFPYLGYFQLMSAVDTWIVFDEIQFINKGWINRNRILHPNKDKVWQYFTLPLSGRKQKDYITNITLCPNANKWKKTIVGKLTFYKKNAPFFNETMDLVNECLKYDELNLSKFITNSLITIANYLEIGTDIKIQSTLSFPDFKIKHPGQWALRIAEQISATEYLNPIGGNHLFKPEEFKKKKISLRFFQHKINKYTQIGRNFTPNLSIIDVLMWQPIEEVKSSIHTNFYNLK